MELKIKINDKDVYETLKSFLKSLHIEIISEQDSTEIQENKEFYNLSSSNLDKAYSLEEPEYTLNMVKEPNPGYETR